MDRSKCGPATASGLTTDSGLLTRDCARDYRLSTRDCFLALVLVLVSCSKPPSPRVLAPIRVCILHTADLHGRVERLSALAAFISTERRRLTALGFKVVHLDAGDFFQGTPEGDLTQGRVVIDAFNEMAVDALVPGNHDFDQGPQVTQSLARAARFPFLAANLRLDGGRGPPDWVRPSLVRKDLRVEILGLAPDAMDRVSSRRAREGLKFLDADRALAGHAWTPGMARIVATHLGIERDRALPLNGIAAVLGGHTHAKHVERLPPGALLIHPGSHGLSIGKLELELDPTTGAVRASRGEVVDIPEGHHDGVKHLVDEQTSEIRRAMSERIGRLTRDLPRGGPDYDGRSSPLGNHVADLARDAVRAEAAVILRSSIRAPLFAGSVRRRDLYEATPFPDSIVAVGVTGEKLRRALERAVSDDERLLVEGAGLEVAYDREAPRGRRIRRIVVGGSVLDPRRAYRIATLELMTESGGLFAGASTLEASGLSLLDAHVAFFRDRADYKPPDFRSRIEPVR